MVAEAEFLCHPTVAFQCLRGQPDCFDMSQPDTAAPLSVNLSRRESVCNFAMVSFLFGLLFDFSFAHQIHDFVVLFRSFFFFFSPSLNSRA